MNIKSPLSNETSLALPTGMRRVQAPPEMGIGRSFASGEPDGDRIRMLLWTPEHTNDTIEKVVQDIQGLAWFGLGAEGPPGHAHGGSQASVLDEAMGAVVWMAGHPCVAGELTVRYLNMLPLGQVVHIHAQVESISGRKVRATGTLTDANGQVFSQAKGLFIAVPSERFEINDAAQAFLKRIKARATSQVPTSDFEHK